ncbi:MULTISPECIES: transcription elongation factor GreA [Deinococcus]|uniref:Transcription elongation factor GreA n=1 Tax=Deinococcus geothermalis (strain DSM 11300 / CIP 105573 / AG-3a) TaxID=319795 RepID=Q1J0L4_DEIGD|nr:MULTISPECIES: transcription elongation factor GreA [Deinococcus]ABF44970.1 transcription elongation factor GreA [Deinococcus geothermalis DSM 11300]MBI0446575.1 transcription elongation factor GreA [Deinococcus sp. DB0503]TDE87467.1 transcription elongation factor GreA [Deinococcus sp. S9]
MTKTRIPMTKRGYDKLRETLEYLKTTRREQISEYMGSAIADGDLRESAAYDEARMQQSENEARILELEDQLERAQIIEEDASGGAGLGAKVKVRDEKGNERQFELVGTYEVDVLKGKISDASPIGQALSGKRPGQIVTVQLPKGSAKFEVLEVTYD